MVISFSPVFVKAAHVGPTAAAFYRSVFGGVGMAGLVLVLGLRWWAGWRLAALAAAAGVLLSVDLMFWHRSIHYVGPGPATVLANLQVFFLAGFGIAFLRERVNWRLALALPLALLGLWLLFGVGWTALTDLHRLGVGLGVLTAASYASYLLVLRAVQSAPGAPPAMATVATLSLCSAVVLGVAAAWQGESLAVPDRFSWWMLVGLGLGPQLIGWLLIAAGLPAVPASRAGLLLLLQPGLAFVWDLVLFGRPTVAVELAGLVLVLGGIYVGTLGEAEAGGTGDVVDEIPT